MRTPLDMWMRQRGGVAHSRDLRTAGYSVHEMRSSVEAGRAERVVADRGSRACAALGTGPVARFAVEDPILNVLYHVGRCQDPSDATAIWESALRIGLVTLPQLRRTEWHSTAVQNVLDVVGTLSDSGVETHFLAIARSCGVEVQQQVVIDGHPVDALIGERLVVQLDGFTHHRKPKDHRRDLRQDARLALLGYTVLRFDYQQVMFDPTYVQQTIINAVAQGLHRARR